MNVDTYTGWPFYRATLITAGPIRTRSLNKTDNKCDVTDNALIGRNSDFTNLSMYNIQNLRCGSCYHYSNEAI